MDPLLIEGQEYTPEVRFDREKGIFDISGRSLHEDTTSFYDRIYDWLQEYINDPNDDTVVNMKITYFNSASHKAIYEMLEFFAELMQMGKKITVNWHYLEDDEDMLEAGEDYQSILKIPFNMIEIEE